MTGADDRPRILKGLDAAAAKRRLSKGERLLRHPFFTVGVSVGMRVLNQALGGKIHLRLRAMTVLGDPMTVVVPSSAEDIWLYGACVESDAEVRLSRFYLRGLSDGDVFFDVGANLGYYSLLASRLVGDSGRVLAFEPAPHILPLLEGNVVGRGNIAIVRTALSDQAGRAKFHVAPDNLIGSSSLEAGWLTQSNVIEVEAVPLDDYCFKTGVFPTHIKMDVEGGEERVLLGARRLLKERSPVVAMEMWFDPPAPAHRRAAALLQEAGYRPYGLREDGTLEDLGAEGLDGHFARMKERYLRIGDHGPDNLVFRRA